MHVFYVVTALLPEKGIYAKTHKGTRHMFGLHFIETGAIQIEWGTFYTYIFNMRQKGDYEDYVDYEENDVLVLIQPATELIFRIEEILSER